MKRRRRGECLASVLLWAWLGAAAAGHAEVGGRALALNGSNFDWFLEERKILNRPGLVMFHVDWCQVCQRTFPKFAAAGGQVWDKAVKMDFAHADCTDEKSLCQRYNVKSYPTILFFSPSDDNTEPRSYRGQRTELEFVKYAERMVRPAVLSLKSAAQLSAATDNETLSAFIAADDSKTRPAGLLAAAKRWQDLHVFAAAPRLDSLLPKSVKPPAGATLAVLSSGEQQWPGANQSGPAEPAVAFYTGSLDDEEAVTEWVARNRFPGIWSLDARTFYFFTHANRSAAVVALDAASVSAAQEQGLRKAASRFADEYLFGVVDGVAWADELVTFNIAKRDLPRVFVMEDDADKWVEDIEALRFDSLEQDLHSLAKGADLLRQDRSTLSRLHLYKRELLRYVEWARAYARRGSRQAICVALACLLTLALLGLLGWGVGSCCSMLFADDPEWLQEPGPHAARAQTRAGADRAKKD